MHAMNTSPSSLCRECRTAPVTDTDPDSDTCGCCQRCAAYIDRLMSGDDYQPTVYYPYREW
jgi:hypothetical protein